MVKVIRKIEKKRVPVVAQKRVAAYARVSVPTERLLHSLDEQISYYSNLIQKTPGWVQLSRIMLRFTQEQQF